MTLDIVQTLDIDNNPKNWFLNSNNITKMSNYKEIVSNLKLQSHPEGGFFKRIYQSEKMIETSTGLR